MSSTALEVPSFPAITETWLSRLAGELNGSDLPLNSTSLAYEAARVVKSGRATLFGLAGFNSGAAQFIQVHDKQSIPADGAVPQFIIYVAAATNFSVAYVLPGRTFFSGIVICNSSTGPTKTIGAADCWFDVQYI